MPVIPISEMDPIQYLIERKFPLVKRQLSGSIGSKAHQAVLEAVKSAEKLRLDLRLRPAAEITALVEQEQRKEAEEFAYKAKKEDDGRFFNQSNTNADYSYWSKAAYWTLDEAVALSFGRNPNIVTWARLESYSQVSPFASEFQQRLELAERSKKMGVLYDPVVPGIFIAWARRLDIDFPGDLENLIVARGNFIGDWKSMHEKEVAAHLKTFEEHVKTVEEYGVKTQELMKWFEDQQTQLMATCRETIDEKDKMIEKLRAQIEDIRRSPPEKPLLQKERESLQKIIIALAIDGLGFQPNATRSPTSGEIADAVSRLGLEIDEDTVRTHLKAAAELLPRDVTEQDRR